jgi:hypothetical protein
MSDTTHNINWTETGASLSDKSARDKFGLQQEEIIQAIRDGKLHYQECSMHGNPWLRLLRHEVDTLVRELRGESYLKVKYLEHELSEVDTELRKAKARIVSLNKQRAVLISTIESTPVKNR